MKKLAVLFAFIAVIMLFAAMPARAEILTYNDCFNIELGPDGVAIPGCGGTGYNDGTWYLYESGWINEWFYNGPFDPNRWKHIEGCVDIAPIDGQAPYAVDFVINWATPEWHYDFPGITEPPLPGMFDPALEDLYIGRELILEFNSDTMPLPGIPLDYGFDIMSFNPEWISIDVMGYNVSVTGTIMHQCIPEPATMSLLALGGLAVLARRRK